MITLDDITLPTDLIWIDEFDWTPVQQTITTSLTGAPIIQAAERSYERTITMEGKPEYAWITRQTLILLNAKKQTPMLKMTLTLNDSSQHTVLFRQNEIPIQARPIIDYSDPQDDDVYSVILRFITVPGA